MDVTKTNNSDQPKFPRSAMMIFLFHGISTFSQFTFRGVLPFYFVEKLKFNENEATVTFHTLMMIQYAAALAGGLLADSVFGKYKSILLSILFVIFGQTLLSVAAIPLLDLPLRELTLLALFVAYIGFGAKSPCVYSFGGDQFSMPQQVKQLSLFFVLMYVVSNVGSTLTYFISPILRKDVRCFGELSCYSLVFAVPTCMVVIAFVILLATKKLYRMRKAEGNIITVKVVQCIGHALSRKLKSKERHEHWLNCAGDKYEIEFIEDIKCTFQMFTLLVPIFMLSALYAAETTTMTFQASRMNGEVAGYLIKPDQIHVIQPLFSIVALPTFHYYIYPFLGKFFHLNTPLKKMTLSLCIAAVSCYIATVVELNLETTYAPKPMKNSAQLRIYNTVDCKATMIIDERKITIDELSMWENLNIVVTEKKMFEYSADFEVCRWLQFSSKKVLGSFEVSEMEANSFALTEEGLSYKFIDRNNKSESGNPLLRALIYTDANVNENDIKLKIKTKEEVLSEIPIGKNITESEFFEVVHGTYSIYFNDQQVQADVPLKIGGVYTVLGHITNTSKIARVITVTPPNSMHIFWILPQQLLLCLALITIDAVGTYFTYSQAPASMKTFMQAYWVFITFFGHLTVVVVTEANFFNRKVFVFLLYAVLMTIATIVFVLLAKSYKYRRISKDDTEQENTQ